MHSKTLPPGTVTPFQAKIYALVQQIPRGKVCSYAALARAASNIPPTSISSKNSLKTASALDLKNRKGARVEKSKKGKCSARAVGGALRRNPFAPEVPCHRVLGSTGFIAGFRGSWDKPCSAASNRTGTTTPSGLGITQDEKRALLKEEGVEFDERGFLANSKGEGCWWDAFDVSKV